MDELLSDDHLDDETFGGPSLDEINDETFGAACSVADGLPSFFNIKSTTVLDVLEGINDSSEELDSQLDNVGKKFPQSTAATSISNTIRDNEQFAQGTYQISHDDLIQFSKLLKKDDKFAIKANENFKRTQNLESFNHDIFKALERERNSSSDDFQNKIVSVTSLEGSRQQSHEVYPYHPTNISLSSQDRNIPRSLPMNPQYNMVPRMYNSGSFELPTGPVPPFLQHNRNVVQGQQVIPPVSPQYSSARNMYNTGPRPHGYPPGQPPPSFGPDPNGSFNRYPGPPPPHMYNGPPPNQFTHPSGVPVQWIGGNNSNRFPEPSTVASVRPSFHGQRHQQHQQLPCGKLMTPSDVRFVVERVLQPTASTDRFQSEYYLIQLRLRKGLLHERDVPLPVWPEMRDRLRQKAEDDRRLLKERTQHWEKTEQVLGHVAKSEVSRPRELLSLQIADEDEDPDASGRTPFTGRAWGVRAAVQRGFEALYAFQELQIMLRVPSVLANAEATIEVQREVRAAHIRLAQSLGLRPLLGGIGQERDGMSLDGGLVGALLQCRKGKQLISRTLPVLLSEERWTLFPVIFARICQSDPAAPEDLIDEERLLQTCLEFATGEASLAIAVRSSQETSSSTTAHEQALLLHLRQCLKAVVVGQMDRTQLRRTLFGCEYRIKSMLSLVAIGDDIIGSVTASSAADEWRQFRDTFLGMIGS